MESPIAATSPCASRADTGANVVMKSPVRWSFCFPGAKLWTVQRNDFFSPQALPRARRGCVEHESKVAVAAQVRRSCKRRRGRPRAYLRGADELPRSRSGKAWLGRRMAPAAPDYPERRVARASSNLKEPARPRDWFGRRGELDFNLGIHHQVRPSHRTLFKRSLHPRTT